MLVFDVLVDFTMEIYALVDQQLVLVSELLLVHVCLNLHILIMNFINSFKYIR